jgi:hypothetical protein
MASFFSQTKENKKTIEKKKNVEKGRSFPSSSRSTLSLLAPASALLFQTFFLDILFFSSRRKEKKKNKEKKP